MSFDLQFYSATGGRLDKTELVDYFAKQPHCLTSNEEASTVVYANPNTGVSARFCIEETHGTLCPSGPKSSKPVQLSFNLNYCRPSFFATETLPIVDRLARTFDLWIMDPQCDAEEPARVSIEEMFVSWSLHNAAAVQVARTMDVNPPFIGRARAMAWWGYQYRKPDLQRLTEGNVFVPDIFLLHDEDTAEVSRAVTWANGIPTLLPECEHVFLIDWDMGHAEATVKGQVEYDTVRHMMAPWIQEAQLPIPNLMVLNLDGSPGGHDRARSLPCAIRRPRGVLPEALVDVPVNP
jgi:hypothetical protein